MKIQAAVAWRKDAALAIEDVELDEPRDDEILVRVKSAGVCHTDINVQQQQFSGMGSNLYAAKQDRGPLLPLGWATAEGFPDACQYE